jgi:hypothetical protein
MGSITVLPDAPANPDQAHDLWAFVDADHDDYARADELEAMHALYAHSGAYTVQRYPAAAPDPADLLDLLELANPRRHPSLSAAERNA